MQLFLTTHTRTQVSLHTHKSFSKGTCGVHIESMRGSIDPQSGYMIANGIYSHLCCSPPFLPSEMPIWLFYTFTSVAHLRIIENTSMLFCKIIRSGIKVLNLTSWLLFLKVKFEFFNSRINWAVNHFYQTWTKFKYEDIHSYLKNPLHWYSLKF